MSISLVTDGMLYPIVTLRQITAPTGTDGTVGEIPVTPCPSGTPTNPPPATPLITQATGPDVPTVPCGTSGNDPTIDPPGVPKGTQGSEDVGSESPATPKCTEGEVT